MQGDDDCDYGPMLIQTSFAKGHLKLARSGRTDSAVYLLLYARDCLKNQRPLPTELSGYLIEAINNIALGMDADLALHTRPGRKTGRPRNSGSRNYQIAERMFLLIEGGASQEAAAEIVSDELSKTGGPTDIKAIKKIFREHRNSVRIHRQIRGGNSRRG